MLSWLRKNGQVTNLGATLLVLLALLAPAIVLGPVIVFLQVAGIGGPSPEYLATQEMAQARHKAMTDAAAQQAAKDFAAW